MQSSGEKSTTNTNHLRRYWLGGGEKRDGKRERRGRRGGREVLEQIQADFIFLLFVAISFHSCIHADYIFPCTG